MPTDVPVVELFSIVPSGIGSERQAYREAGNWADSPPAPSTEGSDSIATRADRPCSPRRWRNGRLFQGSADDLPTVPFWL